MSVEIATRAAAAGLNDLMNWARRPPEDVNDGEGVARDGGTGGGKACELALSKRRLMVRRYRQLPQDTSSVTVQSKVNR